MRNQKGFAPILIILLIALAIGGYLFYSDKIPLPQTTSPLSPSASQEPNGSLETANWKTYTNTKYNFSFKYPSDDSKEYGTFKLLGENNNPKEMDGNLERLSYVNIGYPQSDVAIIFNLYSNPSKLSSERWWRDNSQSLYKFVHTGYSVSEMSDTDLNQAKGPFSVTLIHEAAGLKLKTIYVSHNSYTMEIFGTGSSTNQILSTFKFLDENVEGKACGGFVGETGQFACPEGYKCEYPKPMYPDAQGKCVKE